MSGSAENRGYSGPLGLTVPRLFYRGVAGQKGVCRANPALTINAVLERPAMAPFNACKGEMQLGGAQ